MSKGDFLTDTNSWYMKPRRVREVVGIARRYAITRQVDAQEVDGAYLLGEMHECEYCGHEGHAYNKYCTNCDEPIGMVALQMSIIEDTNGRIYSSHHGVFYRRDGGVRSQLFITHNGKLLEQA